MSPADATSGVTCVTTHISGGSTSVTATLFAADPLSVVASICTACPASPTEMCDEKTPASSVLRVIGAWRAPSAVAVSVTSTPVAGRPWVRSTTRPKTASVLSGAGSSRSVNNATR